MEIVQPIGSVIERIAKNPGETQEKEFFHGNRASILYRTMQCMSTTAK